MRLTTKGRYAVTAMLDLAIHHSRGPVCLAEIAQRQNISLAYLEQLFSRLRRRGLVTSVRGPGGGYTLGKAPGDIAVVDVITAVDEKVDSTNCGGRNNCLNQQQCLTHDLWSDLSQQIYAFLNGISFAQLLECKSVREVALRQDREWGNPRIPCASGDKPVSPTC